MLDWVLTWGGWWFGALGLVAAIVSLVWGFWARKHPPQAEMYTDVHTASIGIPHDPKIHVTYDGVELNAPNLVFIEARHAGGEEIDTFEEGAVVFAPVEGSAGAIKGLLDNSTDHARLDHDTKTISLKPRIFKVGESVSVLAIADGKPELSARVRIANVKQISWADINTGRVWRELWRFRLRVAILFAIMLLAFGGVLAMYLHNNDLALIIYISASLLLLAYTILIVNERRQLLRGRVVFRGYRSR